MTTVKKILADILKGQSELRSMLNPKVIEKSKRHDEMVADVGDVRMAVKSITKFVDENGMDAIRIAYEPIVETIVVTDEDVLSSARFKAINKLNMIPLSDMRKISAAIEDVKK